MHGAPRFRQQVRNTLFGYLLYCSRMILLPLLSLYGAVFEEKRSALSNFELLDYDPSELLAQHERVRRGASESTTIRFTFSAYNK